MKGLQGKNVLVTGAGTGIGKATALRFAEDGARIAVHYRKSRDDAEDTDRQVREICASLREAGCETLLLQADISVEADVRRLFKEVQEAWGRLDVLVNNSGIQKESPSEELSMEDWDQIVGVNLRGSFLCMREAIRHFLSRPGGGVIVNNTSVHETIPKPQFAAYSASKGGMETLTKTLALEYADKGIRINSVAPGAIATPINSPWLSDSEKSASVASRIPMRRVGEPEEMAAVIAFLASDEASYITGQTLFADGGLTLYPSFQENWTS